MVRRSWRDLTGSGAADGPAVAEPVVQDRESGPGQPADPSLLQRMAAEPTGSQLAELLAERERLEMHLATLTGHTAVPGDTSSRYPVTGLAERRAEIDAWARARDARTSGSGATTRPSGPDAATQSTSRGAEAPAARPIEQGLSRDATAAGAGLRSQLFGPIRSGLDRYDRVVGPAREVGRKITGFGDRLDDLDRRLASEGVSRSEREAIRRDLGGSTVDRVAGPIRRVDEALDRPRRLADGLENRWQQREQQLAGPLDRFGSYAASRDRVLDMDTGGSGDLFARAEAARRRALDRRAELDRDERRAEQLHERRHERRMAEKQDAERLDRRGARGKGV